MSILNLFRTFLAYYEHQRKYNVYFFDSNYPISNVTITINKHIK